MNCPVCLNDTVSDVLTLDNVPVAGNIPWNTPEEARGVKKGEIRLVMCEKCGHLFNAGFDASLVDYSQTYENSLFHSPRFRDYAREAAEDLIERYHLRRKHIVEIGSGKGDFLALVCSLGENTGTGFDTSYTGAFDGRQGLTFFRDFYSGQYEHITGDLLLCRHVLEHIQEPRSFLTLLSGILRQNSDGTAVFEVPNGLYMLREKRYWDLIYEHCGYYTPRSLSTLFTACGFAVDSVSETFGGQYLVIHARLDKASSGTDDRCLQAGPETADPVVIRQYAVSMREAFAGTVDRYRHYINRANEGKHIVLWGGGTKGIMFSNLLGLDDRAVRCIVDVNPEKHGKYLTGTGLSIVPPGHLRVCRPDIVLVMNPEYLPEIRRETEAMRLSCIVSSLQD